MIANIALAALLVPLGVVEAERQDRSRQGTPAQAVGLGVEFDAPRLFVPGLSYQVNVVFTAPANGAPVASWLLSPAAFTVDGVPVDDRPQEGFVHLTGGAQLVLTLDLGPFIDAVRPFELAFAKGVSPEGPIQVDVRVVAEEGIDFDALTPERLTEYRVLLRTDQGDMLAEMWPDVAPGHVRNFLALAHDGFYDGTLFHRVIPGFMIQGGDPLTKDETRKSEWGTGGGPRKLQAEFNDRAHQRGVLSAARGGHDIHSASSQFFICHAPAPQLDRQYTAFGKLAWGEAVIDRIVNVPRRVSNNPMDVADNRPHTPPVLLAAIVLAAPPAADAPATGD